MDHVKTGGTLLNMTFTPSLLAGETGIDNLHSLVRSYFKLDGHHMQFNVVTADLLREAKADPASHRGLIVRVAEYSDDFCDLSEALQDEIIRRTEHAAFDDDRCLWQPVTFPGLRRFPQGSVQAWPSGACPRVR
jgi:pyruvate-formate lyase